MKKRLFIILAGALAALIASAEPKLGDWGVGSEYSRDWCHAGLDGFKTLMGDVRGFPVLAQGHQQGFGVSDTHLYLGNSAAIAKLALDGKPVKALPVEGHMGDVAYYRGRVYGAIATGGAKNPKTGERAGVIAVYDEDLNELKRRELPDHPGIDGITVLDDVVYLGLDDHGRVPHRLNRIMRLDLDLNVIDVREFDIGTEVNYGVQCLTAADGKIYGFFYTHQGYHPGSPYTCAVFSRELKVERLYRAFAGQGVDVAPARFQTVPGRTVFLRGGSSFPPANAPDSFRRFNYVFSTLPEGKAKPVLLPDERVTLLAFDSAQACEGASLYKWGGKKDATCGFDAAHRALRIVFTDTELTMTSPKLNAAIVEQVRRSGAPDRMYIRYRGNRIDEGSTTDTHCDTAGDAPGKVNVYALPLGMERDGEIHEAIVPTGGDNVNRLPFDRTKFCQFGIVGRGTGDIEILEVGGIYDGRPDHLLDATPVDVDAVALFPEPKEFKEEGDPLPLGLFAPPVVRGKGLGHAADWFRTEMERFYGKVFDAKGREILLTTDELPERVLHDGYVLQVRPNGIRVLGREPMGVMNGVRTLATLIKQYSDDAGPARVKALTVVDWPRMKNRVFHHMMSCWNHRNRYEPGPYCDLLERYMIGARFNLFTFELAGYYRYENAPGTGDFPQSWNRKDFESVVDRLNAAGAKVVPWVQSPGHQELGLFINPKIHPELREDGWEKTFCMRHPGTYPFLFSIFSEMSDVCSRNPGYKPDVFLCNGDEVQWKPNLGYDARCPRCRDTPRHRLYGEHIRRVDGWCREHGYQSLWATDMLNPSHNGMNRWKLGDARELVPTNAALFSWSGMDHAAIPFWAKRGNDNWKILTGYQDDPTGEDYLKGYGFATFNYNWWLTRTRSSHQGNYGLMAAHLVGALAWGEAPVYRGEWREKTARWGNFLMRNWSRKPIPSGSRTFQPVDLASVASAPLTAKLDYGVKQVGNIPTKIFRDAAGVARGVATGEKPVTVPVGRRAASLVLLHTAHLPPEQKAKFYNRHENYFDWPEGAPTAVWKARFSDGTETAIDVRYGNSVGEGAPVDPSARQVGTLEHYLPDARFAWSDEDGATAYQYEWVNPEPDKEIVSLTLEKTSKHLQYTLWALTSRDVGRFQGGQDLASPHSRHQQLCRAGCRADAPPSRSRPRGRPCGRPSAPSPRGTSRRADASPTSSSSPLPSTTPGSSSPTTRTRRTSSPTRSRCSTTVCRRASS